MIKLGQRWLLVFPLALTMAVTLSPWARAQNATGKPPEASAAPTTDKTTRAQLYFSGGSTLKPFVDWTVRKLQEKYDLPNPKMQYDGTTKGIEEFCAGVGTEFPDVVGTTRPMRKDEFTECQANGVLDIIEVRIGESAVIVATKKGNPVFNITPRMIYLALAAEVPKNGEFVRNTVKNWNETTKDKTVPALPIEMILPGGAQGQRGLFDDRFLQGGCRHLPDIDSIFSADDRVPKCIKLRTDVVKELDEPLGENTLAALQNSAPGTLAVTDLLVSKSNPDKLDQLPVNGILAEHKSIDDYTYIAVSPMIFYFKRAHMLDKEGKGVVRGIPEFMKVITSDSAVGETGAFARMGLEPYNEQEIADIRANVRLLRRFER